MNRSLIPSRQLLAAGLETAILSLVLAAAVLSLRATVAPAREQQAHVGRSAIRPALTARLRPAQGNHFLHAPSPGD